MSQVQPLATHTASSSHVLPSPTLPHSRGARADEAHIFGRPNYVYFASVSTPLVFHFYKTDPEDWELRKVSILCGPMLLGWKSLYGHLHVTCFKEADVL